MLSRKRKIIAGVLVYFALGTTFVLTQLDLIGRYHQFDLRVLGESIYEARTRRGAWPRRIEDLNGTEYLKMPYRREGLEKGQYIILWPVEFEDEPVQNSDKVLAYDNGTVLARLGWVWVCRGDLRTEPMTRKSLQRLLDAGGK